jgi:hypothetical protein
MPLSSPSGPLPATLSLARPRLLTLVPQFGGASELLTAGVSPEVVARQGGWTSLAFLLYWRRVEQILPMNITGAYNRKRVQELAVEMESFRIRNNIPNAVLLDTDT